MTVRIIKQQRSLLSYVFGVCYMNRKRISPITLIIPHHEQYVFIRLLSLISFCIISIYIFLSSLSSFNLFCVYNLYSLNWCIRRFMLTWPNYCRRFFSHLFFCESYTYLGENIPISHFISISITTLLTKHLHTTTFIFCGWCLL